MKIAGDRWQVRLIAMIKIPVGDAEVYANDISLDDFNTFRESYAGIVCYEQKRERNFIDSDHKDNILNS